MAGIVALRILWGFLGTRTARFARFVKGPGKIVAYARTLPSDKPSYSYGHNPVGALFVVGVLIVLAMQVASGLLADPEDFINVGPLAQYVSSETARKALSLHEPLSTLLLLMVLGHIAAILWYKRRKHEKSRDTDDHRLRQASASFPPGPRLSPFKHTEKASGKGALFFLQDLFYKGPEARDGGVSAHLISEQ